MKRTNLIYLLGLLFLSSCGGMRVTTNALKTYPALPENESVSVYFIAQDVPVDSESLGVVRALDSGTTATNKCDSLTAVEHLKSEARKIGGNAVFVTEYRKPSFWGSTCHQMEGTILRVYDFESVLGEDRESLEEIAYGEMQDPAPKRELPRFRFSLDGGYGWRTASLDGLSGTTKEFYSDLSKGLSYQGSFTYYFQETLGIGLTYSGLSADTGNKYDRKGTSQMTYIGADLVSRYPFSKNWILAAQLGFGYSGYSIKQTKVAYYNKEWGASVGGHYSVGLDYMLDKNWAIGLNLSLLSGLVYTSHFDNNGSKTTYKADSADEAVGLGQFKLSLGVRYYIK